MGNSGNSAYNGRAVREAVDAAADLATRPAERHHGGIITDRTIWEEATLIDGTG